jgi:hypothetical protein
MNHADLRANVETILKQFFGEPFTPPPLPEPFALYAPFPNPFRGSTSTIPFRMRAERRAHVGIYDVSGRLVRTLRRGTLPAGHGQAVWDGRDEAGRLAVSGVYFVQLRSDGRALSRTLVRLR